MDFGWIPHLHNIFIDNVKKDNWWVTNEYSYGDVL